MSSSLFVPSHPYFIIIPTLYQTVSYPQVELFHIEYLTKARQYFNEPLITYWPVRIWKERWLDANSGPCACWTILNNWQYFLDIVISWLDVNLENVRHARQNLTLDSLILKYCKKFLHQIIIYIFIFHAYSTQSPSTSIQYSLWENCKTTKIRRVWQTV